MAVFRTFTQITLTVTLLVVTAAGQSATDEIRSLTASENWQAVITRLNNLRQTDASLFRTRGFDYLLARASEKVGDLPTATANYQAVIDRNSTLSAYALWHLAQLARTTGDFSHERDLLRQLIANSPQSMLYDGAALRLGQSAFESGDYKLTVESLERVRTSKNSPLAREASALTGQALVRSQQLKDVRTIFNDLIMKMPDASRPDDFALIAVRELDQLDKSSGTAVELTEADRLLRASVYQFNRNFPEARLHYQAVLTQFPQSGTVPNAVYQIGRGLYSEGKYAEAISSFQRVAQEFPQSLPARDALGYLASSYVRLKQTDIAITHYKELIDRFSEGPNPERPYLNIIDALHEAGRYQEALSWVQQSRSRFKTELGGALATFAQLRIHLAQNSWASVVSDADELAKFPDLGGAKVAGGTTQSEISFLRALALERLDRTDEAITSYLAIPDGRNEYYGLRATLRLQSMASTEQSRLLVQKRLSTLLASARAADQNGDLEALRGASQSALRLTSEKDTRLELIRYLKKSYATSQNYRLPSLKTVSLFDGSEADPKTATESGTPGPTLFVLALYDEAMPELFAAGKINTPDVKGPSDYAFAVAEYSLKAGLANRAVRFGEQLWKTVPADYVLEAAPKELSELLYPAVHKQSLLKHAVERGVDPRFVLSIARQESRYQTDAKSVAAARGMMQFIPSTAVEIATRLRIENFSQDDLYDADTAILFGSEYLSSLFKQFPQQPDAVAAAYNAGADNMIRWQARSRSNEPERYVAEIGFSQTKDYVSRVITNFWNYRRLYDSQFKPFEPDK